MSWKRRIQIFFGLKYKPFRGENVPFGVRYEAILASKKIHHTRLVEINTDLTLSLRQRNILRAREMIQSHLREMATGEEPIKTGLYSIAFWKKEIQDNLDLNDDGEN